MVKIIDSLEVYNELMKHHRVVIDMHAEWCGPCKRIGPDFEKLSKLEEYKNIHFAKLDVDEMEQMNIPLESPKGVPNFVFIKNGQIIGTVSGANLAAIKAKLDELK